MTNAKPPAGICTCPSSYHLKPSGRGGMVHVLDGPLPDLMTVAFGVCEHCGKPYHDRSELGEPDVGH